MQPLEETKLTTLDKIYLQIDVLKNEIRILRFKNPTISKGNEAYKEMGLIQRCARLRKLSDYLISKDTSE